MTTTTQTTTTACPSWCRGDHPHTTVHTAEPRVTDDGWSGEKVSVGVYQAPEDPNGFTEVGVSVDWGFDGIALTPEAAQNLALDLIAAAKEARA